MVEFLKKYINGLHLQVRFVPLVDGDLKVILIDNSYDLKGQTIIPRDAFSKSNVTEKEVFDEFLSPIVAEFGIKKSKIYSNRYKTHKNQEFERFWRGE